MRRLLTRCVPNGRRAQPSQGEADPRSVVKGVDGASTSARISGGRGRGGTMLRWARLQECLPSREVASVRCVPNGRRAQPSQGEADPRSVVKGVDGASTSVRIRAVRGRGRTMPRWPSVRECPPSQRQSESGETPLTAVTGTRQATMFPSLSSPVSLSMKRTLVAGLGGDMPAGSCVA